jgi:hypothetical protein
MLNIGVVKRFVEAFPKRQQAGVENRVQSAKSE